MNLAELIVEFRERADDANGFKLYSDEQAARWASEAESEAAIRGRLLFDDSTDGLTSMTVDANQSVIELDPVVWHIASARFTTATGGRGRELTLVGQDWIEEQCDWPARTTSRPGYLAHYERYRARIWATPAIAGTLQLGVYRLPLNALEDDEDEPEIAIEHHAGLVDWMLHRAYSKKDSEEYDPQRGAAALAAFEANFGRRNTADVMRRHRERRRITTRPI